MFLDTESEVSGLREVPLSEFVLLDLEATLEDFLSLGATDGNVDGDLFVTTDAERSDGVPGFRCDRCLTGELFQHLGGPGQPVTRFADGDICAIPEFPQRTKREVVNALITSFSIRSSFIVFVGTVFCSACMTGEYKGGRREIKSVYGQTMSSSPASVLIIALELDRVNSRLVAVTLTSVPLYI